MKQCLLHYFSANIQQMWTKYIIGINNNSKKKKQVTNSKGEIERQSRHKAFCNFFFFSLLRARSMPWWPSGILVKFVIAIDSILLWLLLLLLLLLYSVYFELVDVIHYHPFLYLIKTSSFLFVFVVCCLIIFVKNTTESCILSLLSMASLYKISHVNIRRRVLHTTGNYFIQRRSFVHIKKSLRLKTTSTFLTWSHRLL